MNLNDDQVYVLEHLKSKERKLLRQLHKSGELKEYLELKAKEGRETRKFLLGGKKEVRPDETAIANEIVRAEMSELPADHTDSPYHDAYLAMERDNPSD